MIIVTQTVRPDIAALAQRKRKSFAPIGSHFSKVYMLALQLDAHGHDASGEYHGRAVDGATPFAIVSPDGRWFEPCYFLRMSKLKKDLAFLVAMRGYSCDQWEIVNTPMPKLAA